MATKMSHWIEAFRLRTLPLAMSSILMGNFLAMYHGHMDFVILALSLITTVLLQILSNLANDLGDSQNGADHSGRKGPSRAVQSGVISVSSMKKAVGLFVVLSLISGIALLVYALGTNDLKFLLFLILGIAAIAGAIYYTMGKKPYGYAGLGDLSVLLFFGFTGVVGTYYLQAGKIDMSLLLPAYTCGAFSVGVLNLNNIRDIESDRNAGKKSIPVRIGASMAKKYHWFLLISGMLTVIAFAAINFDQALRWGYLITLPLFIINGFRLQRAKDSAQIDPLLKQLALSTLLFVLFFGTFLNL